MISSPSVISSRPATIRNAVDLPQPEGPTRIMNSPSWISRFMSLTASKPSGYRFQIPLKWISAMSVCPFFVERSGAYGRGFGVRRGRPRGGEVSGVQLGHRGGRRRDARLLEHVAAIPKRDDVQVVGGAVLAAVDLAPVRPLAEPADPGLRLVGDVHDLAGADLGRLLPTAALLV